MSRSRPLKQAWEEAQREHARVSRERAAAIAERHQELLEVVGYYQALERAFAHLQNLRRAVKSPPQ